MKIIIVIYIMHKMENGIGRLAFSLEIFSEKIHNIPNFESYIGELLEIGVGKALIMQILKKSKHITMI